MTTEATIPHVLGEATLGELEQGLRGQLVRPEDDGLRRGARRSGTARTTSGRR